MTAGNSYSRIACLAVAGVILPSSGQAQTILDPAALPGIAHLWRADGNGQDAVGTEHLQVGAGITFVPGATGGSAFRFTGADGVIVSNTTPHLTHIKNSFTTAFWILPEGFRVSTSQTTRGFEGVSGQRYAMYPDYGGGGLVGGAGVGISVGTNGVSVVEQRFSYVPTPLVWDGPIQGWTHVAVVYDRYVPSLYINGKLVKVGFDTNLRSVITPGDIFPSKTFGSINNYGSFVGALDDVAIFTRALASEEIERLAGVRPPEVNPPRLLNINFGTDLTPSRVGPAAIGMATNDFWNLYSRDNPRGGVRASGSLTNVLWTDAVQSTVDLQVENAAGAANNEYPDSMMGIYLQPSPPVGAIRVTLSDLPTGRYTLIAYGHGGPADSHNTVFNLQSAGVDLGDRATATNTQWRNLVWAEGAQYVAYSNFFVGSNRSIALTASRGSGPTPVINGLQLLYEEASSLSFANTQRLFTNLTEVVLLNGSVDAEIRYTVDGSQPGAASLLYTAPIRLTAATEIRARLFTARQPSSETIVGSFQRVYALNDGIAAAWREQFFGAGYLTDPRVAADADPDNDGANNAQEFANQSNPLDPLSGFAVQVRLVPSIRWTAVPGVRYRVLRKDLIDSPAWTEIQSITPEGNVGTFTDDTVADLPRFYLIEAVRQ